jgi:hypothetical protein
VLTGIVVLFATAIARTARNCSHQKPNHIIVVF